MSLIYLIWEVIIQKDKSHFILQLTYHQERQQWIKQSLKSVVINLANLTQWDELALLFIRTTC